VQLPDRPDLEHLRKQAKARRRERGIPLAAAQHELARDYGFPSSRTAGTGTSSPFEAPSTATTWR
jgi:hypothetical protein